MEQDIKVLIKEHLEGEVFMAQVSNMVKVNFKEMVEIISKPFLVVTIPVIVFAGYMVFAQLTGAGDSISKLSIEVNKLSVAIARLEGDGDD